VLRFKINYQGNQSPWYPIIIASSVSLLAIISISRTESDVLVMIMAAIISVIGLSIFCSLQRQQRNQPQTIAVSETCVLTLDNKDTHYRIAPCSRCTPWFIMLTLHPHHANAVSRRLILWSTGMSITEYRLLSGVVHRSLNQPMQTEFK
jgi:hypothetical protein